MMSDKHGMWQIIKNYKFNSIFVKNLFLFTFIIIIPLSILCSVFYLNSKKNLNDEISTSNISSLNRIRDISDTVFKEIDLIVSSISQQTSVQKFMILKSDNTFDQVSNQIIDYIKNYTSILKYLDSIYIYSVERDFVISNKQNTLFGNFSDKMWYDTYETSNTKLSKIQSRKIDNYYPGFITFVKPVFFDPQKKIGAVVANINTKDLQNIINSEKNNDLEKLYIVNKEGGVVFSNNYDVITSSAIEVPILKDVYQKEEGFSGQLSIEGNIYFVSVIESKYFDMKYISISHFEKYKNKLDSVLIFAINIIIMSLVISFIIAFIISIKTYKPINSIISVIDDSEETNISRNIEGHEIDVNVNNAMIFGNTNKNIDELKYIISNILNSSKANKEMKNELHERLLLLDKANFNALQAQVNPHFLYNTLDTINYIAVSLTGSENPASSAILSLAELFRLNTQNENYLIPIRSEMEYAKLYIDILNLRYDDMFSVIWNIEEKIMDYKIVKLCFQPIIENAIYHGIKPKGKNGIINIIGKMVDDNIIIEITDNGVGISPDKVVDLNTMLQDKQIYNGEHIGMKNVNQRIKILFGENYGIKINSINGESTSVNIKIIAML
jgi:two-component system sensor histidine kinase YesM